MKLTDLSGISVCCVDPQDTLRDAALRMRDEGVGSVVVVRERKPVGILTDRDLALQVVAGGTDPDTPVSEIMSQPVLTVEEDIGILEPLRLMGREGIRRIPLVDAAGRVTGIVALDDYLTLIQKIAGHAGDVGRRQVPGN